MRRTAETSLPWACLLLGSAASSWREGCSSGPAPPPRSSVSSGGGHEGGRRRSRARTPGAPMRRAGCSRMWSPGWSLTALLVPQGMAYAAARRPAADHRPVHLDPVPRGLRAVRAVADPGARPGLLARTDDRRDDPPDGRRERGSGPRGRARLGARADDRRDHRSGGRRQASASSRT